MGSGDCTSCRLMNVALPAVNPGSSLISRKHVPVVPLVPDLFEISFSLSWRRRRKNSALTGWRFGYFV
jgi:hypothetical protein